MALGLPSAVVPHERIHLLNPDHLSYPDVVDAAVQRPAILDHRLLSQAPGSPIAAPERLGRQVGIGTAEVGKRDAGISHQRGRDSAIAR